MLALLILSYRETIKAYPSAGGAYLVTRDNFGIVPAQVAGAALLVGYILTVSVSVSAGTAALISSFDALSPLRVPISLGFIAIVMYGNLRGVKECGQGLRRPHLLLHAQHGRAARVRPRQATPAATCPVARAGGRGQRRGRRRRAPGSSSGASAYVLAKAFASGGAAVTGVEAISNGVPAFKEPAWKQRPADARGHGLRPRRDVPRPVAAWPARSRSLPFEDGTPTVLAQIGEAVYGTGARRRGPQLLAAGRHDAHPRAGRQHRLRRLPPAGQLPGRRQLPAPPAHQARPPARVLQRHHRPGRRRRPPRGRSPAPRSPSSSRSTPSACSSASRCRRRA